MEYSFGAKESIKDYRTVVAEDKVDGALPPQHAYLELRVPSTQDLCNQRRLGICTSCAVRMGVEQHFKDGVRLSEYWLYLMQETLIEPVDTLFNEGSAIFFGLKCAYNYGVPEKDMEIKYPLKVDGSYYDFIVDFKTRYNGKIPQAILDSASKHKITGYKSVPINPLSIAKQISQGKIIMARFTVGDNTYLPSWRPQDLFPLRAPKYIDGGHAWCLNEYFGLDDNQELFIVNSWSNAWGNLGYGNCIFKTQQPYFTEAWIIEPLEKKVIEEIKKLPVPAYPTWLQKFWAIIKKDNLIHFDEKLKRWVYNK